MADTTPSRRPNRGGVRRSRMRSTTNFHLITYEFYIPEEEDGTGILHSPAKWDEWEVRTGRAFGGLSRLPGTVDGRWFDTDRNAFVRDRSRAYVLAIETMREPEFICHMKRTCDEFAQKCLFVERRGVATLVAARRQEWAGPRGSPDAAHSVREAGTTYGTWETSGPGPRNSREERFVATSEGVLKDLEHRIARGDSYPAVAEFALGIDSPLLRGRSVVDPVVLASAAYLRAREVIIAYGVRLGLLRDEEAMGVAEAESAYGNESPACVSRLRTARLLGWTDAEVAAAITAGELVTRVIGGAVVVERASVDRLL